MKKRILSLALALMLVLSLLPMAALAASGEPTQESAEPTGASAEETVVESTPEATPEAAPESMPEAAPESAPEATPEPTPEASGEPDEAMPLALEGAATPLAEVTQSGTTSTVYSAYDLGNALMDYRTTRVKLLKDASVDPTSTFKIKSDDLTIDLNGFDLEIDSEIHIGDDDSHDPFTAKLTITDGSAGAAGELSASMSIYVASGSTLTINSGALKAKNGSGLIRGYISVRGAMNVSGSAKVSASKGVTVSGNSASLTVTGGKFPGEVFIGKGKLSLSGGDFGQLQAASGIELADALADGYAFYGRDSEGNYNTLSKPETDEETGAQWVFFVQVKPHSCTMVKQSDGTYSCMKDGGCGRSGLQDAVKYLDESGAEKECRKYTVVESDTTTWNSGWYVVTENVTLDAPVTISEQSDVHLILCDGKTLTVTGGSVGIYGFDDKQSLTVYGQTGGTGALKAQSTDVTKADDTAESNGIKLHSLTVNGGHVTAISGNAISEDGDAYSQGIEATYFTINGGTVTATGRDATARRSSTGSSYSDARSQGTDVAYLTVKGGSLTANCATATAQGEYGYARENGLAAAYLTVAGGTVTASGGTAENAFDVVANQKFDLSGGTVKSSRADGSIQLSTNELTVSGGTMKLTGGSFLSSAEVKDGASLADLLADGYAFRKFRCVSTTYYDGDWDDYDYDYDETDEGLVPLAGRTALDEDYDTDYNEDDEDVYVLTETWCYYYVEPCTHSTPDGVCVYCGKSVTPGSGNNGGATPAPTATPKPAQSPQTGDEANPALWLALAMVSMMAAALVGRKRRAK